ncbi:hypothetical protein [Streptomyces sp. NPDC058664]
MRHAKAHHAAHRREQRRQYGEPKDVTALKQNPRLAGSILLDQGWGNA